MNIALHGDEQIPNQGGQQSTLLGEDAVFTLAVVLHFAVLVLIDKLQDVDFVLRVQLIFLHCSSCSTHSQPHRAYIYILHTLLGQQALPGKFGICQDGVSAAQSAQRQSVNPCLQPVAVYP